MLIRYLKLFSLAIASWLGLFLMNFLIFAVCARLVMQIIVHAEGGILVNSGIIVSLMDTVAMRLITVGGHHAGTPRDSGNGGSKKFIEPT